MMPALPRQPSTKHMPILPRAEPDPAPMADAVGWRAQLEMEFAERGGRTVLAGKRHYGPLTLQRPFYPEGAPAHLYVLHPPGGLVGGDQVELSAAVGAGAHALITTPGAAKFYRSAGPPATQTQRLSVAPGGVLEWFPQENILFPGANAGLLSEIQLGGDARFIGWEVQCLGRPVIGERFATGSADMGLRIWRDGAPLLIERLRVDGTGSLDGPSGLRGFPVAATFVASGTRAEDLEAVRAQLFRNDLNWSATRVDDLLVARCLAPGSEPVRRLFVALWGILRPRLIGREACPPRIWAT